MNHLTYYSLGQTFVLLFSFVPHDVCMLFESKRGADVQKAQGSVPAVPQLLEQRTVFGRDYQHHGVVNITSINVYFKPYLFSFDLKQV